MVRRTRMPKSEVQAFTEALETQEFVIVKQFFPIAGALRTRLLEKFEAEGYKRFYVQSRGTIKMVMGQPGSSFVEAQEWIRQVEPPLK